LAWLRQPSVLRVRQRRRPEAHRLTLP
jgi:hypothetical protein